VGKKHFLKADNLNIKRKGEMIFKQFNETNTKTLKARGAHLRAHAPRLGIKHKF